MLADAAQARGGLRGRGRRARAGRSGAATPSTTASGHGFIDSQRAGIEVFKRLPPDAPLVVVEAVWQYSHHVLPGLRTHARPDPRSSRTGAASSPGWSACSTSPRASPRPACATPRCGARTSPTTGRATCLRTWLETGTLEPRHEPRARPRRRSASGPEVGARARARGPAAAREGDHRRLRRGLHGDVQRDHRRRAAQPARASSRSGCRRARSSPRWAGSATTRRRPCAPGSTRAGHDVPHGRPTRRRS